MNNKIKKFLIFDLDGVLIDSKNNMEISWQEVQKKHSLHKINFSYYFKHIGRPFFEILRIIGVKKNFKKIKKTYNYISNKNKHLIKYFDNVNTTLKILKRRGYSLNILTSKDYKRTKVFLAKNIKFFDEIECDDGTVNGKPYPDQMEILLQKLKAKKNQCIYIGDTNIDYLTAKNSKVDFLFAKWGYGKNYNYKNKCDKIHDLLKLFKK